MPIVLDGTNGITTPDIDSTGPFTGTTGTFSGNVTANGLTTELRPLVLMTAQNSTSGTAFDFTGIPSWAKRVTVMFSGVSTNSTDSTRVRLLTSGGPVTSGYSAASNTGTYTDGFTVVGPAAAASVMHAIMTLVRVSGNLWVQEHNGYRTSTFTVFNGGGSVDAGAEVTGVRIDGTAGGTFDAGTINVMYE
jgi:hypothetical protein